MMNKSERKELVENTTKQWLQGFMRQYEKDNHTHLALTFFDMVTDVAASLLLHSNRQKTGGHVLVKINPTGETMIKCASNLTTTTVATAIATRDLLNIAIEVALAWSAHCEEMEEAKS